MNFIEYLFLIILKLKYFLGDHPEIQSESGNSQGGNYPCNCGCHVSQFSNLHEVYSRHIDSLEERRRVVNNLGY